MNTSPVRCMKPPAPSTAESHGVHCVLIDTLFTVVMCEVTVLCVRLTLSVTKVVLKVFRGPGSIGPAREGDATNGVALEVLV